MIIFIDTETTGLDPDAGEIIEYTFAEWDAGVRGRVVTRKVRPVGPVPDSAARINGYTPEKWEEAGALPWGGADLDTLFSFIPSAVAGVKPKGIVRVGGHNTNFDLHFFGAQLRRQGWDLPLDHSHRIVDTMTAAAPLLDIGEVTSVTLVSLARYFGIDTSLAHSSAGDVEMTIRVYEEQIRLTLDGLTNPNRMRP